MRRIALAAALLVLAASAVVLGGCSAATTKMDTSKVWGYVASADKTQLDVATDQRGVDTLVVKKVVAPTDAWVVVHADVDGAPGMRVGLTHVKRGETADVKVALKDLTTPNVIVALHADKGTPGKFDFDMMNKEMSADRPFFVNEKEVAKVVVVREFGVKADPAMTSIVASDQAGVTGKLLVAKVAVPLDGWVVASLEKELGPGQIIGLAHVRAGETSGVVVPLEPFKLTDRVSLGLFADEGDPGLFEYDPNDQIHSADQPFLVLGQAVTASVKVR